LKVVIDNYPEDRGETLVMPYRSNDAESSSREIPFSKTVYIDRSDFMEVPSKQFFRLSPGTEVRLRHAYVIRCTRVVHNDAGEVVALHAEYDANTLGKNPEGRKVKGVIHWVSVQEAHPVTLYQYDRLFTDPNPAREDDFLQFINPDSLDVIHGFAEPAVATLPEGEIVQFERLGYYRLQTINPNGVVNACHRVVDLKDSWGKIETKAM
jgi:glutaminyl-tRNA synthetase